MNADMNPPADSARRSSKNLACRRENIMQAEQIVYRDLKSALGKLVIGATSRGCCLLEYEDRGGLDKIKSRITKLYKFGNDQGIKSVFRSA